MKTDSAALIIKHLNMQPHPEGGYYVETGRDHGKNQDRGAYSHIYYLLEDGDISQWHKIDAYEIWHYVSGAPLQLSVSNDMKTLKTVLIGQDFENGQTPHYVLAPHEWQSAKSTGKWSLVSCIVAPAFSFDGFEMAEGDFLKNLSAL